MDVKKGITFLFVIAMISMVSIYLLLPEQNVKFNREVNPTFSLDNNTVLMQFYENMRFPDKDITYKIDSSCSLQKRNEMERAFEIIENSTILDFERAPRDEEIIVSCETENRIEGGLFIAGEGGPTKIVSSGEYNIIFSGKILLIRDSKCPNPNVPIHELLHVLGFNHSDNPDNIMYPISECSQEIGEEIIEKINELYYIDAKPDMYFENISGGIEGKYVNLKIVVRNGGIAKAPSSELKIYFDENEEKTIVIDELEVGTGMTISVSNLYKGIKKISELKISIETDFEEMDQENNVIVLDTSS